MHEKGKNNNDGLLYSQFWKINEGDFVNIFFSLIEIYWLIPHTLH